MNNTTSTEKPLRIVELEIENIKRLHAVHIKPDGENVILGGDNAQGKSSVLDAITMALSGAKCAKPVHGDESKGKVVIDLGEIIVTRTFTAAGGGALTVTAADGTKFSSPQKMLDALLGEISFDPLAFTRMKPKEQLEILRGITGVNTTLMDAARQKAYDERTVINRKVNELRAQIDGMPFHEDAPKEELSAEQLSAEYKAATAANQKRADFITAGRQQSLLLQEIDDGMEKIAQEIAVLRARLEVLKESRGAAFDKLEAMRDEASKMKEIDTTEIVAKIGDITRINKQVQENQLRADAEAALTHHIGASDKLTQQIQDIDERKKARLAAVKYPVEGLALTDDGITYNGIPFSQASAAEQLRVSVGIGIASNPRLRVMLVRDASLLDSKSLAALQALAEEAGAQVWIERVGNGDECTVVIEDGRIAK